MRPSQAETRKFAKEPRLATFKTMSETSRDKTYWVSRLRYWCLQTHRCMNVEHTAWELGARKQWIKIYCLSLQKRRLKEKRRHGENREWIIITSFVKLRSSRTTSLCISCYYGNPNAGFSLQYVSICRIVFRVYGRSSSSYVALCSSYRWLHLSSAVPGCITDSYLYQSFLLRFFYKKGPLSYYSCL